MRFKHTLRSARFLPFGLWIALAATLAAEPSAPNPDGQRPNETTEQHEARLRWFREAKFGMFIHWGVYAVPAGEYHGKQTSDLGEWIMKTLSIPVADYRAFAKDFTASKYDPVAWAKLAKEAGMKYVVLTGKHHDGFALYDSQIGDWTAAKSSGAGRDLITPLAEAVRAQGLKFGLYYSQDLDWVHPGGGTPGEPWDPAQKGNFDEYLKTVSLPQVDEILTRFHPDVLWWDMSLHMTPERVAPFVERIVRERSLVTNNRLGGGYQGDTMTPEQEIPPQGYPGKMFEVNTTLNDTWGFKTNDHHWKSTRLLLHQLTDICSKGGNYLLNVGPTKEGVIPQPCVERLQAIGRWMAVNSEAIYATEAGPFARRLPWGRVTRKPAPNGGETLYLHVWTWPADGVLTLPGVEQQPVAGRLLADGTKVTGELTPAGLAVKLPGVARDPDVSVVALTFDKPVVITHEGYPEPGKDGRISLGPYDGDARGRASDGLDVVGTGADAHLTGWINPNASVEYQVKTPAAGVWTVSAELACAKPTSLRARGDSGGTVTNVPATGGTDHWQTVDLGRVRLPGGLTAFRLVPDSKTWNSADLRRAWLTPSDLSPTTAKVVQPPAGTITLGAEDAMLVNHQSALTALWVEYNSNRANLGHWTNPDDNAVWQADVSTPGNFTVRCTYSKQGKAVPYRLDVGSQTLRGSLDDTGGLGKYQTVDLGTVAIPDAGTCKVTLSPSQPGAFCNLRELLLIPIKP